VTIDKERGMNYDARLDAEGLWTDSPGPITVTSGDRIDPTNARVAEVHINDIAHSLSRQCRYNGHVGGFFSVARHSLWVMEYMDEISGDAQLRMTALLHDAAEAYLGDMVSPLKHGPMGEHYLTAEVQLETVIAARFDLLYPFPSEIKAADDYVLLQRELGGELARWTWTSTPDEDEQAFLLAYRRLVGERRAS
jgi:uncharacterized protein